MTKRNDMFMQSETKRGVTITFISEQIDNITVDSPLDYSETKSLREFYKVPNKSEARIQHLGIPSLTLKKMQ